MRRDSLSSCVADVILSCCCRGTTVLMPSFVDSSSNQLAVEFRLIMSSFSSRLESKDRLTPVRIIGYSRSGVITISNTDTWCERKNSKFYPHKQPAPGAKGEREKRRQGRQERQRERERLLTLRSMNLLRGLYHCIRKMPPTERPQRYL